MDTANLDLMQDFFSDRLSTRLLEIDCNMTDDYLVGSVRSVRRVGLAGDQTSNETFEQLWPTIRYDILFESDRIRDSGFENYVRLRESASPKENATALARFLLVDDETARKLAETPYLFVD